MHVAEADAEADEDVLLTVLEDSMVVVVTSELCDVVDERFVELESEEVARLTELSED